MIDLSILRSIILDGLWTEFWTGFWTGVPFQKVLGSRCVSGRLVND